MHFYEISQILNTEYWVMFSHGTIVKLTSIDSNYKDRILIILKEYGPVKAGTPSGDTNPAQKLDNHGEDWLISYPHCEEILNIVSFNEGVQENEEILVNIAMLGRANRVKDALAPSVIMDNIDLWKHKS